MKRFLKNENASITLEAAMLIPVFLVFVMFLASLIRISVAEMTLDHAVSETAEEIATHVYPAALVIGQAEAATDNYIQQKTGSVLNLDQAKEILSTAMAEFGLELSAEEMAGNIAATALTPYINTKFSEQVGDEFLRNSKVTVEEVNFTSGLGGAIEIVVELELDLFIPFIDKSVTLKKKAHEGLWSTL